MLARIAVKAVMAGGLALQLVGPGLLWASPRQQAPAGASAARVAPHAASPQTGDSGAAPSSPTPTPIVAIPVKPGDARRAAWDRLREGLSNKDSDHRIQAIFALGTMGVHSDNVRLIEAALEDKDSLVRQAAAKTLGDIRSRRSAPELQVALDDKSAAVSFAAAQALWRMGDQSGASIFEQVLDGDRGVSQGLIHSEMHDMHEKLHDPAFLVSFGAEQTAGAFLGPAGFGVTAVEELARDKTAGARALSASLLASSTDPDDRAILDDALADKSWVVRAAAAEALGRAGDSRDIDKLMPLLSEGRPAVMYKSAAAILRISARGSSRSSRKNR